MFREFILGNNQTGLVTSTSGTTNVVGGEDPSLLVGENNILPGESAILFGSGTATSVFVAPSATIASWEAFFASVQSAEAAAASGTNGAANPSSTSAGLKGCSVMPRSVLLLQAVSVALVGYCLL